MKTWVNTVVKTANGLTLAILLLMAMATFAVIARYSIEYAINETRDTSHWVEYDIVRPAKTTFKLGSKPAFISHSEWHLTVLAEWPDVMYCTDIEGPYQGIQRRIGAPVETVKRTPVKMGFYDEFGKLMPGSESGYWQWGGDTPDYESDCVLDPAAHLYPSLGVERVVDIPATTKFHFRRDPTQLL